MWISTDAVQWVRTLMINLCVVYWVAALLASTAARLLLPRFRSLVRYGWQSSGKSQGDALPGAKKADPPTPNLLTKSVSRRMAFLSFYLVGLLASVCWAAGCMFWVDWSALSTGEANAEELERDGDLARQQRTVLPDQGEVTSSIQSANDLATAVILLVLPCGLYSLHILRRLFECLCVHRFRPDSEDRVSFLAALAGASFYVMTPLGFALVSSEVYHGILGSGVSNGTLGRGEEFGEVGPPLGLSRHLMYILGCWLFGQTVQARHHQLLAALRNPVSGTHSDQPTDPAGRTAPAPPATRGEKRRYPSQLGLCGWVQEPHYFGEIVIYISFALLYAHLISQIVLSTGWEHRDSDTASSEEAETLFLGIRLMLVSIFPAVFSLANLAVTAKEKRRNWETVLEDPTKSLPRWLVFPGLY